MSTKHTVTIEDHGRCGLVYYREEKKEILFDWEFCTGECVAEIWPRSLAKLKEDATWPAERLPEILRSVAGEVVTQRAKTCSFEIDEKTCRIAILQREPNSESCAARSRCTTPVEQARG